MIGDLNGSLRAQLKTLNTHMEQKKALIEKEIDNNAMASLERAIHIEAMINLTNYGATGSAPRDARIVDAFEIMKWMFGFKYNEKGSFTPVGARDALKNYLEKDSGKLRLQYSIDGKLAELEAGETNWINLKRFFDSYGVQTYIKNLYPTDYWDIYDGLDSLFKTTKDPTEPSGRPYISQAMEHGSEYLHDYIKDIIHQSFDGKGRWRDALGRFA